MTNENLLFIAFGVVVLFCLALDLGVFQRKSHALSFSSAIKWSCFWIFLALAFNLAVDHYMGRQAALTFLAGYTLELSLSVDNLFVFILIFSAFKIPEKYQHRVLYWGILGALFMRAVCIGAGVAVLQAFSWVTYIFAVTLIYAGFKTAFSGDKDSDPTQSGLVKMIRKIIPISKHYDEQRFFTRKYGRLEATPLFLTLMVVEASDVVFAIDSIPAVLAVTTDPFLVYTSNIFAILGLRSIYFVLAKLVHMFAYLKYGISLILMFVGVKIGISHHYKIDVEYALGFIGVVLALSIILSLLFGRKDAHS